jgi:hypothetical protein
VAQREFDMLWKELRLEQQEAVTIAFVAARLTK